MTIENLNRDAGVAGRTMADRLTELVTDQVDEQVNSDLQAQAVLRLVALNLESHAQGYDA